MSRRLASLCLALLTSVGCGDDATSTTGSGGGSDGSGGGTTTASTGGAGTGGSTLDGPGPGETCDVFAQDCADPAAPKCTVDFVDPTELPSTCQAALGDAALGDLCDRPDGTPGIDTCAPGLFCGLLGQPLSNPQTRACLEDCNEPTDCGADEFCFRLGGPAAPDARLYGVCTGTCDPFDASPCPVSLTRCVPALTIAGAIGWACVPAPASAAEGEACMSDLDCGPLLGCDPASQLCAPSCDDTHPCTPPATCVYGSMVLGVCGTDPTM